MTINEAITKVKNGGDPETLSNEVLNKIMHLMKDEKDIVPYLYQVIGGLKYCVEESLKEIKNLNEKP